jgi:hypothetical protein
MMLGSTKKGAAADVLKTWKREPIWSYTNSRDGVASRQLLRCAGRSASWKRTARRKKGTMKEREREREDHAQKPIMVSLQRGHRENRLLVYGGIEHHLHLPSRRQVSSTICSPIALHNLGGNRHPLYRHFLASGSLSRTVVEPRSGCCSSSVSGKWRRRRSIPAFQQALCAKNSKNRTIGRQP